MKKEIWKTIKEYEGLYEVSNHGRVKRLSGLVSNKKGGLTKVSGKIMKNSVGSHGYLIVGLTKKGKNKTKLVHRLVAEAFIPNPKNKPTVNHKDRDRQNPYIDNLEWATHAENILDSTKNKPKRYNPNNKMKTVIPPNEVEIWKPIKHYEDYYQISNFGNVKRLKTKIRTKKDYYQTINERFLNPYLFKNKGYVVKLTMHSKSKIFYVHRLVAETFLSNFENKPFVRHLDEDFSNNIVFNLEWATSREISTLSFEDSILYNSGVTPEIKITDEENEIWRDIIGYEGFFQVSNFGRIRSLTRIVIDNLGRKRRYKGRIKNSSLKSGYPHVILNKNGKMKPFPVHRLVAQAFIPNPKNKPFVNHKDTDRTNNHVDNLEWNTPKENSEHMSSLDRGKVKPVLQYDLEGNFIQEFPSAKRASKTLGIKYTTLLQALGNPKSSLCFNYQWKFKDDTISIGIHKDKREKEVHQYLLSGEYVQSFPSTLIASNFLKENGYLNAKGANISKVCNGTRNYAYNYQWRNKDSKKPVHSLDVRVNKIIQLTLDGDYLNSFNSIREAEIHLGLSLNTNSIGKCFSGEIEKAHGYRWMNQDDYVFQNI